MPLVVSAGVVLGSLAGMMRGVHMMAVRGVRVVRGLLVIALFMMPGSFAMMLRSLLVVIGSVVVMLSGFLRHDAISSPEMVYR
jgi:hypothetical protein